MDRDQYLKTDTSGSQKILRRVPKRKTICTFITDKVYPHST